MANSLGMWVECVNGLSTSTLLGMESIPYSTPQIFDSAVS